MAPRLLDTDDGIRKRAVIVICELIMKAPKLASLKLLSVLFERLRDRRADIRKELLCRLAAIYQKHRADKTFHEIPVKMLINATAEDKPIIERMFDEKILPRDMAGRGEALIDFVQLLNNSKPAMCHIFEKFLKEKRAIQLEFTKWLEYRKEDEAAMQEQESIFNTKFTILGLSEKPRDFFKKLSTQKDEVFRLLSTVVDPKADYDKQHTAAADLEKRFKKSEYALALIPRLLYTIISKESVKDLQGHLLTDLEDCTPNTKIEDFPSLPLLVLISQV